MEFTTTAKNGRKIKLNYDMPATLEDAVERFTAEVCLDVLTAQAKIRMQNYVRGLLVAETEYGSDKYTEEKIAEKFASWKLTGGNRNVLSKKDKIARVLKDMDPDAAEKLIQEYLAQKKAEAEEDFEEEESEEEEEDF